MKESYNDIQKLLEQLMNARDAGQMTEDIRQADSLLASVPTPEVSRQTLQAIQEKVHKRLAARRAHLMHQRYFTAVAALLLIAILGFVFFVLDPVKNGNSTTPLTTLSAIMNWDDHLGLDAELNTKFENVSTQMDLLNQTAIQWLDGNSSLTLEVEDIEEIASNTDFWKG